MARRRSSAESADRSAAASAAGPAAQSAPAPAAFELDNHIFFWLTQVLGRRDRQLVVALKDHRLRVPEWRVLASLASRQRSSMNELADLATIDRTTLSRTVDRMAKAGWVARLSDADDMRVTRLALTASGRALFARALPAVEELNRGALDGLPPGAAQMLRWSLEQMCANLDRAMPTAAPARSRAA
jgi:DNA-binding MarR family transcriptional regulator